MDHERAARALACDEAEARLKEREDALQRAERTEAENRALITRMMELKLEQARDPGARCRFVFLPFPLGGGALPTCLAPL